MSEGACIEWVEGLAVLLACLIVGSITALNNYKKELQFRSLQAKQDDSRVTLWRNGTVVQVPVNEVCVGDVVQLDTGAKIPAGTPLIFIQKYHDSALLENFCRRWRLDQVQ